MPEPAGSALPAFDPNDYRKRVLAAVERRGGPDGSDPFELYDLPVDGAAAGELDDDAVAERVAAVWAAWQRQRDHPKYRVLVGLLVARHAELSAEVLDPERRRLAAVRVRARREQRESATYELLDAAIARLVQRHGGIPADKAEGLHEVGALAGLTREQVIVRLRRHRLLRSADAGPVGVEPAIGPERRRQVRALLAEFGRLADRPAPPTLLALLGLGHDAGEEAIRRQAAAGRARARELPPERLRAVLDELLVHVADLLEPGSAAVQRYLDAVAADVADHLRPQVRAAVLVEDRLVAEDHAHLLGEAVAMGLDPARAGAVLVALAGELGAPIEAGAAGPGGAGAPSAAPARAWEDVLRAARAALRAGRPAEAQRLVDEAARLAGPGGTPPVRAMADEVAAVLAAAERHVRSARAAAGARRWTEALEHLEQVHRTASDLPDPAGPEAAALRDRARVEVERADRAVAGALARPPAQRAAALLAVLEGCPGHAGALAALAEVPLAAPERVRAERDRGGHVVVSWASSATAGVTYRVSRRRPDGGWTVVGRVTATSLEDGGAPPGPAVPVYAVVALQAGRSSPEGLSEAAPAPAASGEPGGPREPGGPGGPGGPREVRVARLAGGSVEVSWQGPGGVEYRVRCLGPDGRWRVVGRTRAGSIEDGGAGPGVLPVYAVSASVDGVRGVEVRSDGASPEDHRSV
ncbi:MAG TPA: hypothetical protein VM367_03935 [Pseudonocardia sp.]|nr:hypothetical protein [Pseudonocardia sp.]